jgi:hypothetical protein
MNAVTMWSKELIFAPSLLDFKAEVCEIKKGEIVEIQFIYKFDDEFSVVAEIETVVKQGEYAYQPNGSIDPQDEQVFMFDYLEVKGLATVTSSQDVVVFPGQQILLDHDQRIDLNFALRDMAYEDAPNQLQAAFEMAMGF